jgi:hypothetical protein
VIKGRCLCGGIQYEYHGEITEVAVCHCNQCKQAQGTPFVTNAPIQTALFYLTQGEQLLKSYYSSENKRRTFCSACGSPLFSQRTDMPEVIRLRLGSVTQGHIPAPQYQIYCDSKAAWFELAEHQACFAQNKF